MRTTSLLLALSPAVATVPFDTMQHFPYGPFGTLNNVEHHFIDPSKAKSSKVDPSKAKTSKIVKMASNTSFGAAKTSSEEHFPYEPIGAKPYEHHFVSLAGKANNNKKAKAQKNVDMASTNSITSPPNPDEFQEAREAVLHAVEIAEHGLFRFDRRCEQAAEHAIEEEVDVFFGKDKK